jgi:hypothetical protein
MLVVVVDFHEVQVASEGILVRRACVVGDLDAPAAVVRIFIQIEVGGLGETVMRWRGSGRTIEVVHVREAGKTMRRRKWGDGADSLHSCNELFSWPRRHCEVAKD